MFIDSPEQIKTIAEHTHLAIFAIREAEIPKIKAFYVLEPNDTGKITIEDARSLVEACSLKQATSTYIVIKHAETLLPGAENALLKLFEEPNSNYHFLLFTEDPSALLPTILSRAEIYYLYQRDKLSAPVDGTEDIKALARELLTARGSHLIKLATDFSKKKPDPRLYTLNILETAIEIAYKTYFATKRPAFLGKISSLLGCYENIKRGGHIKLHIVADLC